MLCLFGFIKKPPKPSQVKWFTFRQMFDESACKKRQFHTKVTLNLRPIDSSGKSLTLIFHKAPILEIYLLDSRIKKVPLIFLSICWDEERLFSRRLLDQEMTPFVAGAKSMQINPFFISLWIIQAFALLFGVRELNKIIRKVENVDIYWPVEERGDPALGLTKSPLWSRREPLKRSYSTLTDQHGGRSSTCNKKWCLSKNQLLLHP